MTHDPSVNSILLSVLKRHAKVTREEMRPFCPRVVSSLEEKNMELCLLAAKILNLMLTHPDVVEHLGDAGAGGLGERAFRSIHENLRRFAAMRDTRLFSQATVVMGKMLKTSMVTPTKETASALQGGFSFVGTYEVQNNK